jgi:hypothetical protein
MMIRHSEPILLPSDAVDIRLGMSNFDGSIDDGFEEALRREPNKAYGWHAAWDYIGASWFDGKKFHNEIRRHGSHVGTVSADTLPELLRKTIDEYGSK